MVLTAMGHVAMAGDKDDDGRGDLGVPAVPCSSQPGHAAHADVHDQAGHFTRVVAGQERLRRIEAANAVILALQQPLK